MWMYLISSSPQLHIHHGSMLYLRSIDPLELTRERLELQYWKSLYKHVTADVAQGKYGDLMSLRTAVCNDEGLSDLNLSMDILKVAAEFILASIFQSAVVASAAFVFQDLTRPLT